MLTLVTYSRPTRRHWLSLCRSSSFGGTAAWRWAIWGILNRLDLRHSGWGLTAKTLIYDTDNKDIIGRGLKIQSWAAFRDRFLALAHRFCPREFPLSKINNDQLNRNWIEEELPMGLAGGISNLFQSCWHGRGNNEPGDFVSPLVIFDIH